MHDAAFFGKTKDIASEITLPAIPGSFDQDDLGDLDDRVAAIVGPAVQAAVEQRGGHEVAQDALALLLAEGRLGGLVLHQFDAEEIAVAADIADDR